MHIVIVVLVISIFSVLPLKHPRSHATSLSDLTKPLMPLRLQRDTLPKCIEQLIKRYKTGLPQHAPGQIVEYELKGKKVYYLLAKCCDQYNHLIDENCLSICKPDGGWSGRGDNKCAELRKQLTNSKVLWKDNRRPSKVKS